MSREKKEYKEISLFRHPIETLKILFTIINEQLVKLIKFLISHKAFLIIIILYIVFNFISGSHDEVTIRYLTISFSTSF
jgi:hypothetical protein